MRGTQCLGLVLSINAYHEYTIKQFMQAHKTLTIVCQVQKECMSKLEVTTHLLTSITHVSVSTESVR